MPLIKLATAARRARVGSVNTIRRALITAGVPLVTLSPGVLAVEEADLNRFLQRREDEPAPPPPPKPRRNTAEQPGQSPAPASRPGRRKRRQ